MKNYKEKLKPEPTKTRFRLWKSGKKWLCAGLMVTVLATGGVVLATGGFLSSHVVISHADTVSGNSVSILNVEAISRYSHTENGHNEGDPFFIGSPAPSVSVVGSNTVVTGEIVRDGIGVEGGTIRITYSLTFNNQGVYQGGTVTSSGYVTAKLVNLVVGQKYDGTYKFIETSDGYSGSGSYLYPIEGTITLKVNELNGKLDVDKTTSQFGDNFPNVNYSFTGLAFDVYKKGTDTVIKSFVVDSKGKMSGLELPAGNYFLREKSSVWSTTGQTKRPDINFTIEAGKTTTIGEDKLKNEAVTGTISVSKQAKGYGKTLPNSNYDFSGIQYKVTSEDGKYTDTITLDKNGNATTKAMPLSKYTVQEVASSVTSKSGMTYNDKVYTAELKYKDQNTALVTNATATENEAVTGTISVSKQAKGYGKTLPNSNYDFSGIQYKITSEDGKYTDTITLDKNGNATTKAMPLSKYTVQEVASSVTSKSGMTYNDKVYTAELKYKDQNTVLVTNATATENIAVTGQITITKTGVESGTNLWNGNYSLEGNEFQLIGQTDSKNYFVSTDKNGKATIDKLPLQTYDIIEVRASNGFVNTFVKKSVTLTYKDQNTEIVFGKTSGTNQEIKGENELLKLDKDSGKAESQGKAELKGAEYELVYLDNSTGSSSHKEGDSVKWSDIPKATLNSGEKVTESVINGKTVSHGDKIVVRVDAKKFNAYVGNLAVGKYAWKEINAPVGYASDKTVHEFEVKKKDDKTQTIITPQTKSLEQVIKAKLSIQKKVEIAGENAESGFNDINFNLTPINGTKGEVQTITTGIKNDEDGYADFELVYGDYKLTEDEATAPDGYDLIKPIYIHMTTDPETDIITISASHNKDFSKPFSTRTFSQSDNADGKNENIKGSVAGSVSSDVPFISLSKLIFTDKETTPEIPSIDIEKSSEKISQAGQGNNTDKDDNLGKGDADTKETLIKLSDKAQTINFRVTNNGTETLTHVKVTDKTIEGKQDVKDIKWTYEGKALTINKDREFELDGKLLELPVDDYIEATGTLDKLPDGELHADEATVTAKGAISGETVGDKDKWYGEKEKTPDTPTSEKPTSSLPSTGETTAKFAGIIGILTVIGVALFKFKTIHTLLSKFKK